MSPVDPSPGAGALIHAVDGPGLEALLPLMGAVGSELQTEAADGLLQACRQAQSLTVLAWDGPRCMGAAAMLPVHADQPSAAPLLAAGLNPALTACLASPRILQPYRNRGLEQRFLALREAAAAQMGLEYCAFVASSTEPELHPAADPALWRASGYRPCAAGRVWSRWLKPLAARRATG